MYENIIGQEVTSRLAYDIKNKTFPNSVLLSGPAASGKLTTALETARGLSCQGTGEWQCTCPSCVRVKALTSPYIMLLGPRESSLEIAAAKDAFVDAVINEASYIDGARQFFLRAVRKLTMRFNTILWDGEQNINKAASLTSEIDERLAEIDKSAPISSEDELSKTVNKIEEACQKLETTLLYDTIPVRQIRNVSSWARLKVTGGKRVIIIEAADKMLDSVRNSLLKILEEPPEDTVFILTTAHRAAVMSTILSRVRTYTLRERTKEEQEQVLDRVFHARCDGEYVTIKDYLDTFLPAKPDVVRSQAREYMQSVTAFRFADTGAVVKSCASFKPRALLAIFIDELAKCVSSMSGSYATSIAAAEAFDAIREASVAIGTYNISPAAALESLFVSLSRINRKYADKG